MAKSVALGFGAAGAVVAAAVIAVVGSTVGLGAEEESNDLGTVLVGSEAPASASAGTVVSSEVVTTAAGEQVEYVYVDAPASRGDDDDQYQDDDEHDDDDEREYGEHDDEDEHEDDD